MRFIAFIALLLSVLSLHFWTVTAQYHNNNPNNALCEKAPNVQLLGPTYVDEDQNTPTDGSDPSPYDPSGTGAINAFLHVMDHQMIVGSVNGGLFKTDNFHTDNPRYYAIDNYLPCSSISALGYPRAVNTKGDYYHCKTEAECKILFAGCGFVSNGSPRSGELRGALISTDSGRSWNLLRALPYGISISAIRGILQPNGDYTIIVGVQNSLYDDGDEPYTRYYRENLQSFAPRIDNLGLWVSTNNGTSFTQSNSNTVVYDIDHYPSDPNKLIAVGVDLFSTYRLNNATVVKSNDGGISWSSFSLASSINTACNSISVHNNAYAVNRYKVINAKVSFFNDTVYHLLYATRGVSVTAPSTTLYCFVLFTTFDDGATWKISADTNDFLNTQLDTNVCLTADQNNPDIVYTGSTYARWRVNSRNVKTRTNLLTAFKPARLGNSVHVDCRKMLWDRVTNDMIDTNDGGIYVYIMPNSIDAVDPPSNGARATQARTKGYAYTRNGNLALSEYYQVAYDYRTGTLLGASQDNCVHYNRYGVAGNFSYLTRGDGLVALVDDNPSLPYSYAYMSAQRLSSFTRWSLLPGPVNTSSWALAYDMLSSMPIANFAEYSFEENNQMNDEKRSPPISMKSAEYREMHLENMKNGFQVNINNNNNKPKNKQPIRGAHHSFTLLHNGQLDEDDDHDNDDDDDTNDDQYPKYPRVSSSDASHAKIAIAATFQTYVIRNPYSPNNPIICNVGAVGCFMLNIEPYDAPAYLTLPGTEKAYGDSFVWGGPTHGFVANDETFYILIGRNITLAATTIYIAGHGNYSVPHESFKPLKNGLRSHPRSTSLLYFVTENDVWRSDHFATTASWTNITGDLHRVSQATSTCLPKTTVVIDNIDGTKGTNKDYHAVVVGTVYGLYYLFDSLLTSAKYYETITGVNSTVKPPPSPADLGIEWKWNLFGLGMPHTPITGLQYNEQMDILIIGTFGRGMWMLSQVKYYLSQQLKSRSPSSINAPLTPLTIADSKYCSPSETAVIPPSLQSWAPKPASNNNGLSSSSTGSSGPITSVSSSSTGSAGSITSMSSSSSGSVFIDISSSSTGSSAGGANNGGISSGSSVDDDKKISTSVLIGAVIASVVGGIIIGAVIASHLVMKRARQQKTVELVKMSTGGDIPVVPV